MSGNLTDSAENRMINWLTGNTTTAPTTPLKLRLMTANGDDATAGTEVIGGSYAPQTVTLGAASGGQATNTADVVFTGMPEADIVGAEIWDSAGTPFRWWWGPLAAPKSVTAGQPFTIPAGSLTVGLD